MTPLPPHLELRSMEPPDARPSGLRIEHATYVVLDDGGWGGPSATVVRASDRVEAWPTASSFLARVFSQPGSPELKQGVFVISAAKDYDHPFTVRYNVERIGSLADYLP